MNVLIFVMTMLMLLSLMTYARLETYRSSQTFQIIFKNYMQEDERGYINLQADKVYESIVVTEKENKDDKKKPAAKKNDASPRIGIGLLFNPDREAKGKDWEQTKVLLKNLMRKLYSEQPFYKKLEAQRPNFVDDLVKSITQTVDELPKDVKPKHAVGLANLKLPDPLLDRVLYKMLHGASYMNVLNEEQKKVAEQKGFVIKERLSNKEIETASSDEVSGDDIDEFKSPEGYFSLLDFVNSGSKPKIRVYLAPKEVLQAIFNDKATVNSIIEERQRLYQQTDADGAIEQLSESFKNQFMKLKDSSIEDETLNFSISKTNPKYYK
ncbi:MAG TPA: hypothetical protein VGP47_09605 [Parachlamydiaceae bacterium]|nr:hypothetical protein [Parachlamydiaceae bacterium]